MTSASRPTPSVIDATGKWVTPGIVAGFSRLGLSEVDLRSTARTTTPPATARSAPRSTSRRRSTPWPTTIAVNRADGVTRAIVAPEQRQEHLRRPGRGDRHRRRHDPVTARAPVPVRRAGRNRRRQGRRIARLGACPVPQRACARRPSFGALRRRFAAARADGRARRSAEIPTIAAAIGPTRSAARTCC